MSFTYTQNIPLDTNSPAEDQPDMKDNTNSTYSILNVDLYTFDSANAGKHQQVTIPARNAPGAQTDPACVVYTAAGTASTVSNLILRNQNATFLLSCIRAFGVFTGAAGAIVASNSYNISSISGAVGATVYTITLTAGATTGSSACILVHCSSAAANEINTHVTLAANVVTITTAQTSASYTISFVVLQA